MGRFLRPADGRSPSQPPPDTDKDEVKEVDDFDYAPYGSYPGAAGTWPDGRYAAARQPDIPFRPVPSAPRRAPDDGLRAYGYQPWETSHEHGYPAPGGRPRQAYQPGPWRAAAFSGPMPAYRPDSGPMPAYRGTALLAGPPPISGPMPAYRGARDTGPGPAVPGKRIPGWLPFSNRLLLLPKGAAFEGGGELREHRDSGGWLRPAVFGAMDGLVTNSSLIAGIGGGGGGHGMIVLTGIAGLIAGAFSMATGEYISVKAQNELTAAEVELERRQHARDPEGKRARLTELYMDKGVSPNLAEAVVRQISADMDRAVAAHVREELGIDPDDLPSPQTAAIASFTAFTVGALIPLSPFLLGYPVLNAALAIAGASAFAGGAAVANLTGRSPWLGGLRQFTAAFLATGMAFVIGHLVGAHVG